MQFPDMDQKSFNRFNGIRKRVSEVVEETLLILQENQCDLLLELVDAVSRWTFSSLDLLQGSLIRPSATGKINSTIFFGKYHLFRIESFLSRFPMRPSSPTPQGLQPVRHPSKFTRVQCVSEEQSR